VEKLGWAMYHELDKNLKMWEDYKKSKVL